jgi:carboxylesterase
MDTPKLLKGAEPFYYPGNEIGCLTIHGFTGTPFEVRWLGQHLNRQGYTVYGPRLAGHGTHIRDMVPIRWREWYLDVLAAYKLLRARCEQVFVLGLSMGGALSMALAAHEPVDGAVAMSAIYRLEGWQRVLLPLAGLFVRAMPKGGPPPEDNPFQRRVIAEQKARGEEPFGHPTYPAFPVRSAGQLVKLLRFVRAGLPSITAPVLLMHSRADDTVPFEHLQLYYNAIGSADKQTLILEKSLHCIAEDVERELVFEAAADFIKARSR